jgi:5-methylcytosine-specific restriction enzyme A
MANLRGRHWRRWYGDARWRRLRDHQLHVQPLCEECRALGKTIRATVVDHLEPHGGDINKFYTGKLRSLCAEHHNHKWADDKRGYSTVVDENGVPIDPRHPFNQHRP